MNGAVGPGRKTILAALREVLDPELGYHVVDLGLWCTGWRSRAGGCGPGLR